MKLKPIRYIYECSVLSEGCHLGWSSDQLDLFLVKVAILDEAQTNQIYLIMFCFSEGSHPAWSTDHSDIFQNRITQRLFLPNAILFYFIVIAHFKVGTCTAGFKFEKHITLHKTIKKKDSELFWPFEADKSK
jgi:hypothetical protein